MKLISAPKGTFCPACMMTQRLLRSKYHFNDFTVTHFNGNMSDRNSLEDKGFSSFPIVEPNDKLDDKAYSGFRPHNLSLAVKIARKND